MVRLLGADNGSESAEVIRRLGIQTQREVDRNVATPSSTLDLEADVKDALLNPTSVWEAISRLDSPSLARHLHACSHNVLS